MWVPLIENNEMDNDGADYFIKKHIHQLLQQSPTIDTIILGCTHYPLLKTQLQKQLPQSVNLLSQGTIVAEGLKDYLNRHPKMEQSISKTALLHFLTTDSSELFDKQASLFYGQSINSQSINL